jgi:hypothetical protein
MTSSTASESAQEKHGSGSGLYIALVPWVAFTLLAQHSTLKLASVVPREHWGSPTFKQINRRITLMWAFVFTAMIPFHIAAGVIDERRTNILFNWVVPIGLLIWGIKQSGEIADEATAA